MDNIIDIELTGRSTRRDQKLWQYDYGQMLRISGKEFPKVTEVQFSLQRSGGHTLDRIGTFDNGVLAVQIPNELLQNKGETSDYTIYAFVYLSGDESGNTKYMVQLPVESRPEPTDPSEDPSIDPSIFKDAVNAVNASANRAEVAEKSARESAAKAKGYAESAGKSKEDVENARDNAITAIDTAKESALSDIASKTDESLQKIQSQTEESQNGIKQSIADATEKKTELDGAISNATDAKGNLDKAVQSAGNAKTELDTSVEKASESKSALDGSIGSAGEKKLALDATVEHANTVDTSLKEQIGSAEQIQANVEQIAKNKTDISSLNEDLVYLSSKTASNETKAYDVTDLFTLKGFLNKKGEFVSNAVSLCTDYIDAKKGEVYYFYISQDDKLSLPVAIYNTDKIFVKGVENKGNTYLLQYFEYTVEEDCLIRISSMNADSSLIYKKEFKNNSEVFDEINTKIGQLETYYEDKTQYVLEHKTDDIYLRDDSAEIPYSGGLVSDYIEVDEGDSIKAGSYVLYGNPVLVMYYANKKMYKSFAIVDNGFNTVTTVIPPMVKYIRISSLDSSKGINFQILRHKSLIDSIKESSKEKNYVIPNTYDKLALTNTTSGYIQDNGTIYSVDSYITSDYIDLDNYDYFRLVSDYAYNACGYVTFDDNKKVLSYVKDSNNTLKRLDIVSQDIFPTAKYIRFCGTTNNLHIYVKKQTTSITNGLEEALETGNVLYHKKIAFCGDSFTEATNLGKTLYDNFIGCYKSFGWRIANRNKMKLYHDGISGSTMHVANKEKPNDKHPFAYERYKNVPVDCDYIILQFGLNESNIADSDTTKGAKDSTDTTTMWGSWNTVLGYLIENHPTARIGIIMSDAWMPQAYYTALKEICEWWGIPLLDLGGDPNVPVMNGGRRAGSGLVLNPKVAELRNATFYNADGDAHPNDKGHEWRSTVIENWIRSL